MYIIGLTGGIASGKSTVVSILKDLHFTLIEADRVAREVVREGGEVYLKLKEAFPQAFTYKGELNRRLLAHLIHKDDEARELVNAITHPPILASIEERIATYTEMGLHLIFVDLPLLFEVGMEDWFNEIWLVYVEREVQILRLMERDALSREEAQDRISSQLPLDSKIALSHRIIDNSSDRETLYQRVCSTLLSFSKENKIL